MTAKEFYQNTNIEYKNGEEKMFQFAESYKEHCINSISDEMIVKEAKETFKDELQHIAFVSCWIYVKQKL